jgi:hypothetical protein
VSAETAPSDRPPKPGGRVDSVDCVRGVALIGMALYHLSWDLADYRLVSPTLPFSPPMRLFSHVVACAFLALVGVSLALAHRDRLNLPAFWRRLAVVGGAAALLTGASLVFAPGEGIWFGILHCIAVASLLALPFIGAPAFASLLAGAIAIAIPFFVQSTLFDPPALMWLGLGVALPNTLDWRPLLPWGGVVFLGLGGLLCRTPQPPDLSRPPANPDGTRCGRGLARRRPGRAGAEAGLQRLSRGLRARLRRRRTGGGGMQKLMPVRRRRHRALGRGGAARCGRARRSAQGRVQADGGRLHDALRYIKRKRAVVSGVQFVIAILCDFKGLR